MVGPISCKKKRKKKVFWLEIVPRPPQKYPLQTQSAVTGSAALLCRLQRLRPCYDSQIMNI